jgi:hypothetical protein
MNKWVLVLAVLICTSAPAFGQGRPEFELAGGYSHLQFKDLHFNGWNASIAQYVSNSVAFKLEGAGHYNTAQALDDWYHTFLYGPQFRFNKGGGLTPFTHAMAGVAVEHVKRRGATASVRDTHFAMNVGGGIDIRIRGGVAFRPIQIDWTYSRVNRDTLNGARLSAGFVYRFAFE